MADPKEYLAAHVIGYMKDKRVIGLGTGKTVRFVISRISNNYELFKDKLFIGSSIDTETLLVKYGFNVLSIVSGIRPEIYIDSFDIYDGRILIKGKGGALLREKLLAYNSGLRIYVGDYTKYQKPKIYQIPVEVIPISLNYVINKLKIMNIDAEIREEGSKIGPIMSDNGNVLINLKVKDDPSLDLCKLSEDLKKIPGIIETGIFCKELYDIIVLADENGRLEIIQKSSYS